VALVAADPTDLARRRRWLRPVAITLILTLTAMVVLADVLLISNLVTAPT